MYWTLELAHHLEEAPWPATRDELIDYAIRSGAPLEVIENLQAEGKAVLCILHDMDFAAAVFERVVVFSQGQLLLEGGAREVFSKKDLLQQAYLDQPQAMKIAQALGMQGYLLSVEEVISALEKP